MTASEHIKCTEQADSRFVLFDLDGTLTDPAPGITASCAYALRRFGIEISDLSTLRCYIGPPLVQSFQRFHGLSPEEAARALKVYREYFGVRGLFENSVYDGIPQLLARLRGDGYTLLTATSKPEPYTVQILEHFELLSFFDGIGANTMDETRADKAAVIRHIAAQYPALSPQNSLMIGDRLYDIEGAHACGLRAVGVLYGYGSRAELEEAGADLIAPTVDALYELIRAALPAAGAKGSKTPGIGI